MVSGSLMLPKEGVYKVAAHRVTGPSSYPAGGFEVKIPELKKIYAVVVSCSDAYFPCVVSVTDNVVKILVKDTTGSEVSSGTDLSGITFNIIAFGE